MKEKKENSEHYLENSPYFLNLEKPHKNCLVCNFEIKNSSLYKRFRICPSCKYHYSTTLRRKIAIVADKGSFNEINKWIESIDPLAFEPKISYKKRLSQDQSRTQLKEAVITGTCTIGGNNCVLIILDSSFMGGTMGLVVGEKISLALEHAGKKKIPAIGIITSSGKRIQEGVFSLNQMAKTVIATKLIKEKNIPFIVSLGNPCTGQVLSSFASMADIIISEPMAHIGFSSLGDLRRSEGNHIFKEHLSESYFHNGHIDKIVERNNLKNELSSILSLLSSKLKISSNNKNPSKIFDKKNPKESVKLSRNNRRPTSKFFINELFSNFTELHGDRTSGDDDSIILGLGNINGQTLIIAAQEKLKNTSNEFSGLGEITPSGFRKAIRGARLAETLNLCFLTIIDSSGPKIGTEFEKQGLASVIANTIYELSNISTPTISIIIGEGTSESAIAFTVTDRILMMENAIYSPIQPELAAEIETSKISGIDDVSKALKLTSLDCKEIGMVDEIIPEPLKGAHENPKESAELVKNILINELSYLNSLNIYTLLKNRHKKIRDIGNFSNKYKSSIIREISYIGKGIKTSIKSLKK